MALVEVGHGLDPLTVPDEWDAGRVREAVRTAYPFLFSDLREAHEAQQRALAATADSPDPERDYLRVASGIEAPKTLDELMAGRQFAVEPPPPPAPEPLSFSEKVQELARLGGRELQASLGDILAGLTRTQTMGADNPVANTLRSWPAPATPPQTVEQLEVNPLFRAGRDYADAIRALRPVDPRVEDSYVGKVVGSTASTAPVIGAGMVGGVPLASLLYAAQSAEQGAQEAVAAKRPDLQTDAARGYALAALATEPLLGVAGRLPGVGKVASRFIPNERLAGALEGAIREAIQEPTEQLGQNVTARATFDPNRPVTEGLAESSAVAAPIGGLFGAAGGTARTQRIQAIRKRLAEADVPEVERTQLKAELKDAIQVPSLRTKKNPYTEAVRKAGWAMSEVDFITPTTAEEAIELQKRLQSISKTEGMVEAFFDPRTGKATVFMPAIKSPQHLQQILSEERAHLWIASPEGQTELDGFIAKHPLSAEQEILLQKAGYTGDTRALTDEFIAKLNRDSGFKRMFLDAVAWLKSKVGLRLTPEQAGRIVLRNLRRVQNAVQKQSPDPGVLRQEQKQAETGQDLGLPQVDAGNAQPEAAAGAGTRTAATIADPEAGLYDFVAPDGVTPVDRVAVRRAPRLSTDSDLTTQAQPEGRTPIDEYMDLARKESGQPAKKTYTPDDAKKQIEADLTGNPVQRRVKTARPRRKTDNRRSRKPEPKETKGGYTTLASAFVDELATGVPVNPVGRQVRSVEDAHAVANLFRNPKFEVFRWVLIKKGKVVRVVNVSSRLAGSVTPFGDDVVRSIDDVEKIAVESGADSFFVTHNHPSGRSDPSLADILVTRKLFRKESGAIANAPKLAGADFLGHIVTNHNIHAHISPGGSVEEHYIPDAAPDPFVKSGWPAVRDTTQQIRAVKAMFPESRDRGIMLLLIASNNLLRGVVHVDPQQYGSLKNDLPALANSFGSRFAVAYAFDPEGETLAKKLLRDRILSDVYSQNHPDGIPNAVARGLPEPATQKEVQVVSDERTKMRFSLASDNAYFDAVERGDMETAQKMVDEAARRAGYNIGPVWHGGSFDIETGDREFSEWTHFGTKSAAEERVGGSKIVDTLLGDLGVFEVEGGWSYAIEGLESERVFKTEEAAKRAAEREALEIADNAEPPDASFTRVFLRGQYARLPDLGTWGMFDIVRHLPEQYKLTKDEVDLVGDLTRYGKLGEDYAKLASILRDKGLSGFSYTNLVEDKRSTSYVVFNPSQIKSADPVTYDDNGNVIPLSERFKADSPDIRFSIAPASPRNVERILRLFRNTFDLPTVEIGQVPSGPKRYVVEGDKLTIDPTGLSEFDLKLALSNAAGEAATVRLGDKQVDRLYSDIKKRSKWIKDASTSEERRAALQEFLTNTAGSRVTANPLRRWVTRTLLRLYPQGMVNNRLLDSLLSTDRAPSYFEATDQRQVYADQHRTVWNIVRPLIVALRMTAGELELRSYERRQFGYWTKKFENMAEAARARVIGNPDIGVTTNDQGEPEPMAFNPASRKFIEELEAVGVPVTPEDADNHARYLQELAARGLVEDLNQLDALNSTRARLTEMLAKIGKDAEYDFTDLDEQIAKLQKKVSEAEESVRERARVIRISDSAVPEAQAAVLALQDPQVKEWSKILDEIEASRTTQRQQDGRVVDVPITPRPQSELSDNLADMVSRADWAHAYAIREFVTRVGQERDAFLTRYGKEFRRLHKALTRIQSKEGELEVAISDIAKTLAGELGMSGSTRSREAVAALRDLDTAIARFVARMAQDNPDPTVRQVRDALLAWPALTENEPLPLQGTEGSQWVREWSKAFGLSEEAVQRIERLLRGNPEFRNAIVTLYEASNTATRTATITAIEQIEALLAQDTDEGRAEATRIADETVGRMARRLREYVRKDSSVERDLDLLEAERRSKELLREFANSLPNQEFPDVARMTFVDQQGAQFFASFTGPDGKQVEGFGVSPANQYDLDTLKRVLAWVEKAVGAIETRSDDAIVLRGLRVAIPIARQWIDARFTEGQIIKTLGPNFAQRVLEGPLRALLDKDFLGNLVPGIWGRNISARARRWIDSENQKQRLLEKHTKPRYKLLKAAAMSLNLDINGRPGDADLFWKAYNEIAHRARQFGSGVAVGDRFWSVGLEGDDRYVTPALLNLLRYDERHVFGDALKVAQRFAYAGVREKRLGRRIVRAQAKVGDISLARMANMDKVAELANDARNSRLPDFFARNPDFLRFHVLDSSRVDSVIDRDPRMRKAEKQLVADINRGDQQMPANFDEWVKAIADRIQGHPDPATFAKAQLLAEVEQSVNIAKSKVEAIVSGSPATSQVSVDSAKDESEFTQPAAKLSYPGSMYQYGASTSLVEALNRSIEPPFLEFVTALAQGADYLRTWANKVKKAIAENRPSVNRAKGPGYGDLAQEIRWHLGVPPTTEITDKLAARAAELAEERAAILSAEARTLKAPSSRANPILTAFRRLTTWLMTSPMPLITNIVQGPIAAYPVYSSVHGGTYAGALVLRDLAVSAGIAVGILARRLAGTMANLPPLETQTYLAGQGIGGSHDREMLSQQELWARGFTKRSMAAAGLDALTAQVNRLQGVIGARAGDTALNTYLATTVIPHVIQQMRGYALRWQDRLAKAGLTYDPTKAETLFGEQDWAGAENLRTILGKVSDGTPEDFLLKLARGEVNPRRFFEHPEGSRLGDEIIQEVNFGTPANRPGQSSWLLLFGWTANLLNRTVAASRLPADSSAARRAANALQTTLTVGLLGAIIAYVGAYARYTVGKGLSVALEEVAQILSGAPDDDDEQWAWIDWLSDALARMVGNMRNDPVFGLGFRGLFNTGEFVATGTSQAMAQAPQPNPLIAWDGWADRPIQTIVLQSLQEAGKGLGVNGFTLPIIGMGEQAGKAGATAGRAAVKLATADSKEDLTGVGMDLKEATRAASSLLGLLGRSVFEGIFSTREEQKARRSIVVAAGKAGVSPRPFVPQAGLLASEPVARELMDAGRAMLAGEKGAEEKVRRIAGFAYNRAYDRAIDRGDSEAEAAKAAGSAVRTLLGRINPFERALGGPVRADKYEEIAKAVADDEHVQRDLQTQRAIVDLLASSPPTGMRPFRPTPGMLSPVKRTMEGGGGVSFSSGVARAVRRRGTRRSVPRLRGRRSKTFRGLRTRKLRRRRVRV